MDGAPLVRAVHRSSLPRQTKAEVFLLEAKHHCVEYRLAGLSGLREAAADKFRKALVDSLERLPNAAVPFPLDCPEADVARFVLKEEDPALWELLQKVAKRSDVALRMEVLRRVGQSKPSPPQRQRVLDFLAAFLDDTDRLKSPLRDIADRMEARNYAAVQIAEILDIEVDADKERTAEDWAKLRAQVREALQRESAKSKKQPAPESKPKRGQ